METQESGLNAYEVPFVEQGSPLYIELHKSRSRPNRMRMGILIATLNTFGIEQWNYLRRTNGLHAGYTASSCLPDLPCV